MKAKTKNKPLTAFTTSFDLFSISVTVKATGLREAKKLARAKLAGMNVLKYVNPHATFTDKTY